MENVTERQICYFGFTLLKLSSMKLSIGQSAIISKYFHGDVCFTLARGTTVSLAGTLRILSVWHRDASAPTMEGQLSG